MKIKVPLVSPPHSPSLEKQPGLSVVNVLPQQPAFKVSIQKCQDDVHLQEMALLRLPLANRARVGDGQVKGFLDSEGSPRKRSSCFLAQTHGNTGVS